MNRRGGVVAALACGAVAFGGVGVGIGSAQPSAPTPAVGDAPNVPPPAALPPPPLQVPGVPLAPVSPPQLPGVPALPGVPLMPPVSGAKVQVVASGLQIPWDIGFLPDGSALVNERAGRFQIITDPTRPGSAVQRVSADFGDVTAIGDGGVSGMAVYPDFAQSRRVLTCQTHYEAGRAVDVRMVTWQLNPDGSAHPVLDPLLAGLQVPAVGELAASLPGAVPASTATRGAPLYTGQPIDAGGLHSDCRPRFGPDGALWVATGDGAIASAPQDLRSLAGKTLRIDANTGGPAAGNPFLRSADPVQRLIFSYGHRNPQGIAFQPGTGRVYLADHGPDVDDELSILVPGGNYGWDPSLGGEIEGYTGPVPRVAAPMTDLRRFPRAVPAVWSSGTPTVAPADIEFLADPRWGPRQGMVAVATLRGANLLLMRLGPDGRVTEVSTMPELAGTYGRLRAVETGPDGALYVTTSNGTDDKLLRVAPF